jgi:hypothetical protein
VVCVWIGLLSIQRGIVVVVVFEDMVGLRREQVATK